ncbi:TetR/AcrR family transcriptional regulator [Promicromonospora thailandica]|uniref:Transcriptional regulator, TetR family n=1 Tax=Promicromonospora thailandica TaxID=765201 RepID=A0A9X2G7B4_9MICO|nr:TetR/AcrR family transcriptional regulator [Promicromonospora thailandica]MCP2263226.1 transcriptional regulator, TetR family [Promicromonospora thailandica]BFF18614.1 TetR/AcrR family transcriptional regulator [Promicromonospora thailandica]
MADEEAAREQVVRAADELFYTKGVQAVGMDAVRTAAGVSLKRIYSLFSSKDELVVAVLRHRTAVWDDGIASASERATTARARLLAIFDFLDGWFREPDFRGCAFINTHGELSATSQAVADAVREQKRTFQEYVARLVAELDGPPELAPQIAILAEGAQTTAAIAGTPDAARYARDAVETLLDAKVPASV